VATDNTGNNALDAAQAGREAAKFLNKNTAAARIKQRGSMIYSQVHTELAQRSKRSGLKDCLSDEQQRAIADTIIFAVSMVDARQQERTGSFGALVDSFKEATWPVRLSIVAALIAIVSALSSGAGQIYSYSITVIVPHIAQLFTPTPAPAAPAEAPSEDPANP